MHDITYYEYNVMLFKCDGGTGWLRVGLVSQLVMRSFDVADKGELNKGEGPLGRRGERTPDHNHSKGEEKGEKRRKVWVEAGSSFTVSRQDIKRSTFRDN